MLVRIGLTTCSVLLLLGAGACRKAAAPEVAPEAQSFNVPTLAVQEQQGQGYVELTGTVTGETSVALSTKLMSEITALKVEEGERVKAGQVLVRIDDADIRAMRSEAAAYRAEATAALGEVQAVVAQGEAGKAQAQAAVKQAQAAYDDAKRDFERADRLAQEDSIPRAQRDKAELGMKVAEENLHRAQSAVSQADGAIAQAQSKTPQIQAKQQQAAAKDSQAAALQGYATLAAPFDGVVTKKYFKQGQLSIPGQPIVMVEDVRSFRVQLAVPDNLLATLKQGQQLEVLLEGADGEQSVTMGKIVVLGAAADAASHTVKAELALTPVPGLFSGRFARIRLPAGAKTTLAIPLSAVLHEGDVSYVWRVSPSGVLAQVPVEIGPARDGQVPVVRGLSADDVIVTAPTPELFAGAHVTGAAAKATP
jgi:RND family efflux transporter MFP subunit